MVAKKRAPKSPGRDSWMVILEDIRSQNRTTLEAVFSVRDELRGEIQKLREEFGLRLDALEAAVRQNSADIRQNSADIRQNSADIRQLRLELEELKAKVGRIEAELSSEHHQRLLRLEERVAALEERRSA